MLSTTPRRSSPLWNHRCRAQTTILTQGDRDRRRTRSKARWQCRSARLHPPGKAGDVIGCAATQSTAPGCRSRPRAQASASPVKRGEGHALAPAERGDAQTLGNLPCQHTAPTHRTIGNSGLHHAATIRRKTASARSG